MFTLFVLVTLADDEPVFVVAIFVDDVKVVIPVRRAVFSWRSMRLFT
jgi:hypothetical protein